MRKVVVNMQNALFSDAISEALKGFSSDFQVYQSETPGKTRDLCAYTQPDILLMEVTSHAPWRLEDRMILLQEEKAKKTDCKIVLVVDENTDAKLTERVRQAKKDGLIDQFLYGSVSAAYLSAVIDTL